MRVSWIHLPPRELLWGSVLDEGWVVQLCGDVLKFLCIFEVEGKQEGFAY